MKDKFLFIAFAISLTFNIVVFADAVIGCAKKPQAQEQTAVLEIEQEIRQNTAATDWNTFITALAYVESKHNDNAVSNRQAVGYLQITPILVEDANRIEGNETFTLEGRSDRQESIHLFNVIQDYYNPEHDLHLALKIWNPRSKLSYHTAVMDKYNELLNSAI